MPLIFLVDIGQEAPSCEVLLFIGQPGGCGWVVGEKEAGDYGYSDGDCPFLWTNMSD